MKQAKTRQVAEPRYDMEIRQLRAFVALVEHGLVIRAAQALGLSQSTVSESIATLERRLGAAVVLRQRGRVNAVRLTGAGRALLPHARRVIAAVDEACVAVNSALGPNRAHVAIVASESVTTYCLPTVLARLRKKWPDAEFAISVARAMEIRDRVACGKCDVGLLLERTERCSEVSGISGKRTQISGLVVLPDVKLVMFAGAPHPLQGRSVARESLAPFRLFVSEAALDFREFINRYMSRRSVVRLRIESAGSVEGVKRAVASEACAIGLLPAFTLIDELQQRRFVALDLRPPPPRMQLRALRPGSKQAHPVLGELLNLLAGSDHGK